MSDNINEIVSYYKENIDRVKWFGDTVTNFFLKNEQFNISPMPLVHSVKSRIKDPEHLREKLIRKSSGDREINSSNLFNQITDLAGVRVLHIYHGQFPQIHNLIMAQIGAKWKLYEEPTAYSWDPETKQMYDELNIKCEIRDTFYTSVHYIVRPNNEIDNTICCEIQVRTLFEEIWGEVDHSINYPKPYDSVGCSEQLRVLSKLACAGTRLADSIFRTYNEAEAIRSDIDKALKILG